MESNSRLSVKEPGIERRQAIIEAMHEIRPEINRRIALSVKCSCIKAENLPHHCSMRTYKTGLQAINNYSIQCAYRGVQKWKQADQRATEQDT